MLSKMKVVITKAIRRGYLRAFPDNDWKTFYEVIPNSKVEMTK